MAWREPIPTMGYPSQKAAIVALFLDGVPAREIAELVGTSINSVQRSITSYRKKNGIPTPERSLSSPYIAREPINPMWDMEEDKRRQAIIRRAAEGARIARLAA